MLWSALFGSISSAQESVFELDSSCTISILNRTIQVSENGGWSLPNVPSFMGRIRARATCIEDGQTISGESDFFTVVENGIAEVGDIRFTDPEPIPNGLSFTSSSLPLNGIGDSYQTTVTATFSDDSSSDYTQSPGINYFSSNTDIVSVDQNGLITAVGSGNGLVTARVEGVIALLPISASTSGDLDSDGLPDDYELANGLDPNDPFDAMEDQDGDGLSALQEFQTGTDLNLADTDGDGIEDGEELIAGADGFITNPLFFDSDGDGIGDGLEIDTGSDPNDGNSTNLANALDSISVSKTDIVLVFNTLNTEISERISVTGTLTDGLTLDLTSQSTGTTYQSSNLAVASFGSTDGEIFGGADGVTTITVANSGFQAHVFVTVTSFSPSPVGFTSLPDNARDVAVKDNYAYIAADTTGLVVMDVSNPAAMMEIYREDTPGAALDVRIQDNLLFLADGTSGIRIYDITSPFLPQFIAELDTPGTAQDISMVGNQLYVADGGQGLAVIDVSVPSTPILLGQLTGISLIGIDANDSYVVGVGGTNLYTVDVSNASSPSISQTLNIGSVKDVVVRDGFAYIAAHTTGHVVVNVNTMTQVANSSEFFPRDVVVRGDHAFYAETFFVSATPYVNIADPDNAVFQGVIDYSAFGDYDGIGIALNDTHVYMVARKAEKARLLSAQYDSFVDDNGVAPTISIVYPGQFDEIYENKKTIFSLDVSDDVAVASVRLEVNGEMVSFDNTPPFNVGYRVPEGVDSLTVVALALDLGGNTGDTGEQVFSVIPDNDPGYELLTDFRNWSPAGNLSVASWDVASNGSTVLQSGNNGSDGGRPSFFVSPYNILNQTIRGKFKVETTIDDDFIGFALGLTNPINSSSSEFLDGVLFDWRQSQQTLSSGGTGPEGFTLMRGDSLSMTSNVGNSYFVHSLSGASEVIATDYGNSKGWLDNHDHYFEATYNANQLKIRIDGETIFNESRSFDPGRFALYNYSQGSVRYDVFSDYLDRVQLEGDVMGISPAINLTNSATERNEFAYIFNEKADYILSSDLTVDLDQPGSIGNGSSSPRGSIRAGTRVNSYFVSGNPVGVDELITLRGSIVFEDQVLGIVGDLNTLTNTGNVFENRLTTYTDYGPVDSNDPVTLSQDRKTVTFNFVLNTHFDQMRIVTESGSPPDQSIAQVTHSGQIKGILPPASVDNNVLESDAVMFLFKEQENVTLTSSISVNAMGPGTYDRGNTLTTSAIPASTVVDSYFVHFDTLGITGSNVNGKLVFDNEVLGIIGLPNELDASAAVLGDSSTVYAAPAGASFGDGDNPPSSSAINDQLILSQNKKELTIKLGASTGIDQIRIVTKP